MITPEIVSQAENNYGRAIGRDVMRKLRAMSEGSLDEPMVTDELFDDDSGELYSISLCPSQYGAASDIKIQNMKILVPELRKKLKELHVTDLMMDLTETAVMPHCEFRIVLTGCTNACTTPYFSDFGVLGVYEVALVSDKCMGCGQCVSYCSRGVISMSAGLPVFDKRLCIRCGGCEEFCPETAIKVEKMGYKVVAGGTGSRFPKIAQTVVEYTDLDGVLKTLEEIVGLIRENHTPGRVFDISGLVEDYRKSL
jgi:NAD-dependent dihydropyrimidine dehydrogenase PreA subunit